MLEELKQKTGILLSRVYDLAAASEAIEVTDLETVEPRLAEELGLLDEKIDVLGQQIRTLLDDVNATGVPSNGDERSDFILKLNKIIDDAELIDAQILAIPRPKSKVGKPKYYERIAVMTQKIETAIQQISQLKSSIPPENPNSPPTRDMPFIE